MVNCSVFSGWHPNFSKGISSSCLNLDLNQKNGFRLMICVRMCVHRYTKSPVSEQGRTPGFPPVKGLVISAIHLLHKYYTLFIIQIFSFVSPSRHMVGLHFLFPLWVASHRNSSGQQLCAEWEEGLIAPVSPSSAYLPLAQ